MFKKIIPLSALLLTLFSALLFAQQTATPDAPAKTNARMGRGQAMQPHMAADPTTRAQKMTDHLTKQLGLDEVTSKKVYDLALARAQQVNDIQKSSADNKTKINALKANAGEFKGQLQSLLTPDQFAKFESMRGRMGRGRGNSSSESEKEDSDQK